MNPISDADFQQLVDWTVEIQQIPSPTFSESKRAAYLEERFKMLGMQEVQLDEAGNVLCRLPGGSAAPLLITAHMDTVHPMSQDLNVSQTPYEITGAGIGDNALGVAALLSMADFFLHSDPPPAGDVWFAGTVGEEGLGNLKGIKALVPRFPDPPHCTIVLEGIGLGQIQQKALGSTRLRITVETPGGHSWSDYGSPSAIHILVGLGASIKSIKIPTHPRTSLNIGMIRGGTTINTIATSAIMEIDLRSEDAETLTTLSEYVRNKTEHIRQEGVRVTLEEIGSRPSGSIPQNDPFLVYSARILANLGVPPHFIISSTDGSYLIQKHWPVLSIGLTTGNRVHTPEETIDLLPLRIGIQQLRLMTSEIWSVKTPQSRIN